MRELLDAPTQRRLHILEQLNEVSDWISSNDLAKENNASLRTINNDISYLKDNWHPRLLIETSKKNGVRLRTQPSSHIELIYSYVLKNSDAFRLLESVFFDTTLSIEKWGERLFISESSLYRITNSISSSLEKYGLYLEKKPCRIIGVNEFSVRYFYTSFFREAYSVTEWPFKSNKKNAIKLVQNMIDQLKLDLSFDENEILHVSHILNVSLIRQSQGFFITHLSTQHISQQYKDAFQSNEELLADLAQEYGLTLTQEVLDDLIITFFYHLDAWNDQNEKLLIITEIDQFVRSILDAFRLKLTNKELLKLEVSMRHLYLFHKVYPFRNFIIFDKYYYNGIAIKQNFPMLNNVVENSLKSMEKKTGFPWNSSFHYVILYWIMIKWKNLPQLLEDKKEKATILVMSELGNDHVTFLTKMIDTNFGSKAIITPYTGSILFLDEVSHKDFSDYDIIITNFNTELLPHDKLIVIDDIPSNLDWGTLRRGINNINKMSPNFLTSFKNE